MIGFIVFITIVDLENTDSWRWLYPIDTIKTVAPEWLLKDVPILVQT